MSSESGPGRDPRRQSALVAIALFAAAKLLFHTVVNRHYGFHRDELATLDDARHLAWGFVAYPPLTPFVGRAALALFGTSLAGFRFFAAAAQSVAIVFTASLAREMGGDRAAQWIAALAMAASAVSLAASSLFQYVSFDYLWWVLVAWLVARTAATGDPRWWAATGFVLGLGALTKYTILFLVAGLLAGFFATPLRKHFRSPWLWAGAAIALIVAAPHILWEWKHGFVSLEFLKSIHARDVRIGRTDRFLSHQLFVPANPFAVPIWATGLAALIVSPSLRRFRILAWMAVVPFALFLAARGRDYYTAPIFPMLLAAGAAWVFGRLPERSAARRWSMIVAVPVLLLAAGAAAAFVTPAAPVGTRWWRSALEANSDLKEEIGWPELVEEVARVSSAIPAPERARTAIYCANYGEAGAVNLYGPPKGLPAAISGINSFWARGYGDPAPETLIVLGVRRERLAARFESVVLAGRVPNPLGVANEESEHPDIYVCRGLREGWPAFWARVRGFG